MNNKNIFVVLVSVILAVAISFFFIQPKNTSTTQVVERAVGSAPGSSLSTVDWTVNGVKTLNFSSGMSTATTTPCVFKIPQDALLLSATVQFTTSSTTATTVSLARGATYGATTTQLSTVQTLNANEAEIMYATTTDNIIFQSGSYFTVGMSKTDGANQNSTLGVYSPVGKCSATFQAFGN